MTKAKKQLKLTLIRSIFGLKKGHAQSVRGLGLRRLHHTVVVEDTPCNRGMITKAAYLLKVEEVAA